MKLPCGQVWPIPIYLDVATENYFANNTDTSLDSLLPGARVVLNDPYTNTPLAILSVADKFTLDKSLEAEQVYATSDLAHPAVNYLFNSTAETILGGKLQVINQVSHSDFVDLRKSPAETRAHFDAVAWSDIVAFQTRNPMHRAHLELTKRAAEQTNSKLFVHPVVGMTKPGDIDYTTRVNVYKMIMEHYPENSAYLSLLPLAMRMAGPKEAVLHAIIRRNYGASHFIVGRDHAGPGKNSQGIDFYSPYEAQSLVESLQSVLQIKIVPFSMLIYIPNENRYEEISNVAPGTKTLSISGTELRDRLKSGADIPDWFSYENVVRVLPCYSILKTNDIPTKFKVVVIKAIIHDVATYVDAATQTLAKCGKSAAMVRLGQESIQTDLNIKTAVARSRTFEKGANLIKCPTNIDMIYGCYDAGTSFNWMGLELVYPELKTHIHYVFKIRNGTYWTAWRYAKSGFIKKEFIEECPFCRKIASETIEHMLLESQVATKPPLLPASISMRLVGKFLGEELKLSITIIFKDLTVLYVKTTLATANFLNAIALPRYLILSSIILVLIPISMPTGY
ncbi:hypothetical protein BB561_003395 [Smittium simulii]|uniref:sulfate adenylyltransferase n=1 Tax=Smittium simulii TaxID=133385 RepID=A0A2T9YLM0_9FUNG|nr:hypothetical protein BB561_003395 [Smittium simulii]